MSTDPNTPRRWLRTPEAAAHLGLSVSYLEKLRLVPGAGPRFSKAGKAVAYDVADLDAFMTRNLHVSTDRKAA